MGDVVEHTRPKHLNICARYTLFDCELSGGGVIEVLIRRGSFLNRPFGHLGFLEKRLRILISA